LILTEPPSKLRKWRRQKKKLLSFKTPIHDSHEQNTVFHFSSIYTLPNIDVAIIRVSQQRKSIASRPWEILTELRSELAAEKQMPIRDFS